MGKASRRVRSAAPKARRGFDRILDFAKGVAAANDPVRLAVMATRNRLRAALDAAIDAEEAYVEIVKDCRRPKPLALLHAAMDLLWPILAQPEWREDGVKKSLAPAGPRKASRPPEPLGEVIRALYASGITSIDEQMEILSQLCFHTESYAATPFRTLVRKTISHARKKAERT